MTASDRMREIGKDIHWEGSSTYNRPLVGAVALAKAFDEILLVVEAAERGRERSVLLEQDISGIEKVGWRVEDAQAINFALQALDEALS